MRRVTRSVASVGVVVMCVSLVPGLGARRAKTTPLSATIAPASFLIDDRLGPYPALFSAGYFQLGLSGTGSTPDRSMAVNFQDCELDCTAPFSGTTIDVYNNPVPLLNALSAMENLPIGSTISTRFRVHFHDATGTVWVLRYFGDTETCGTDMPTALANATRTSATEWTLSAPAGSVACLLRIQTVKGHQIETPAGRFRVPFSITLVK